MDKITRVKAALAGKAVDRPPVSLWKHFPLQDQNPLKLASAHVSFQEKYDLDFIKLTPSEHYCVEDWGCKIKHFGTETQSSELLRYRVETEGDWLSIIPLLATNGVWGKQVELAKYVKELAKSDVPFVQTVYSPLTVARKLAGDRLVDDLRDYPQRIHSALEAITETTIGFIKANLAVGAAGIFFATACANYDFINADEYEEFGRAYDLEVLKAAAGGWFNILHIHGQKIFFDELLDYPVHAINWHDCHEYPPVKTARKMSDKCIIGGLDEEGAISHGKPFEVIEEVAAFLSQTDLRGVMVGPGCVTIPNPPHNNIGAIRLVVERYAEEGNWKYLSMDSAAL